ncbi:IPTL-CTERM sorting domain-containing protein [Ottowia caeni]|uniref:IPTL-CTERM sorting domain-containing protein n=1 Tax=Ottowia caeni TaxID=2870339 RepID=UPI003D733FEE
MTNKISLPRFPILARFVAAATLATSILAPVPLSAQTVTTWLDNQTEPHQCSFGGAPDAATRFRTGSVPMTLENVDIAWGNGGSNPGGYNRVGIFAHDASTNLPGSTQVGGWQEASGPTQPGTTMSYSGQTIALSAHTDYWLVVDIADGTQLACTLSATFNAPAEAGAPAMSQFLIGGTIGDPWGDGPRSNYNPIYALAGSLGTPPEGAPDMSVGLINLPASAAVGTPYAGSFQCANIGQQATVDGATCSASGLPPGLDLGSCTVSPSDVAWNQLDVVPAGETVTCQISGTPQAAGVFTALLRTVTEVDSNLANNEATRVITIVTAGQSPTTGGIQAVPTLSEWAILLLGGLLSVAVMRRIRAVSP